MALIYKIGVIDVDSFLFIFNMQGKKKPENSENEPINDEYDSQSDYSTSELENIPSNLYFDV